MIQKDIKGKYFVKVVCVENTAPVSLTQRGSDERSVFLSENKSEEYSVNEEDEHE